MFNLEEFMNSKIPVVEIFQSISGEGISAGYIVTFLRVAGCNLRCSYCDTKYSYDESCSENLLLTPEEIYNRIKDLGCNDVLCTGGEPLEENKAKRYLPLYLASKGLRVRIETNGSCNLYNEDELKYFCSNSFHKLYYVLDAKCPSSGFKSSNILLSNYSLLREGDEIKFVVADVVDVEYALGILEEYGNIFSRSKIVVNFSPVFTSMKPDNLVNILKENQRRFTESNLKVRLSLQLHKFIWNPEMKGV